jgi:hypothetical protein
MATATTRNVHVNLAFLAMHANYQIAAWCKDLCVRGTVYAYMAAATAILDTRDWRVSRLWVVVSIVLLVAYANTAHASANPVTQVPLVKWQRLAHATAPVTDAVKAVDAFVFRDVPVTPANQPCCVLKHATRVACASPVGAIVILATRV